MPKKRKGRRARGTGSVFYHEGHRRWVARKVVKGVAVERWGATQREAIDKLAEALPPDPASVTVSQWAGRWRGTFTGRESTRHNAGISLDRHILPAIGDLRLADVTAAHVEKLKADMLAADLSGGTVGKVLGHARQLFGAAVRNDLLVKNPAAHVRKPRPTAGEVRPYTPAELARIISAAARFAAGGVIATLAATGMRVGEVLALDVTDWDATASTLAVTKTYSLRFGTGEPKSRHSKRTVTVPDILFPVLGAAAGRRESGPLFRTEKGNRRPAQTVTTAFRSVLRAAKLPRRKLHSLRHSVATALIGANVPLPDVAKYIGDSVATVVRVYLHPTQTDPALTLNRLYGVHKVGNAPAEGARSVQWREDVGLHTVTVGEGVGATK